MYLVIYTKNRKTEFGRTKPEESERGRPKEWQYSTLLTRLYGYTYHKNLSRMNNFVFSILGTETFYINVKIK